MLVYNSTKAEFALDVKTNSIEEKILAAFKRQLGHSTSSSEVEAWRNSMQFMNNVLNDDGIPADAGVAIEYRLPSSNKRIDFILTGKNADDLDTAIIVELKQWSEVKATSKDGVVSTWVGKAEREVSHPSYQAWTYAALLEDFNEVVRNDGIVLKPCAYLHNLASADVIQSPFYREHLEKAPAFLKSDTLKLADFIKQHVRRGDRDKVMYRIDQGRIKPSKSLADCLLSLLQGNNEFLMIDDQKIVYENALHLADIAEKQGKQVLIVEGGPGTGKSVVAINLLVEMTNREKVVHYVTKNAAPRAVYESKLAGTMKKTRINNLFKGSGSYTESAKDSIDVLVVDEAHRLNARSGMYQNKGENQIKEIIHSAKCSVFFIDEDQRVTFKDVGEKDEIRAWAKLQGAKVHELQLQSQFRCNGSDGYLAWLDNALQIRVTANESLDGVDYDFRVFDSPAKLRDAIFAKNKINNKARLVAGYCWDWVSKQNPKAFDIVFPEHDFAMKWNLADDGALWIVKSESISEVGCIHTCQGLEVDYVGVIIGDDFVVRNGKVVTDARKRSGQDSSVRGYVGLLATNPDLAKSKADAIIRNTYRTLMTRGAKGCYIYCTDQETAEWFAKVTGRQTVDGGVVEAESFPLTLVASSDVQPFKNAVPLYDLKIAAGAFGRPQFVEELYGGAGLEVESCKWVALPDPFRYQPGLFVAQVVGESMNKRIPNGAWCLFKANPVGSRNGKIVLARHRDIRDPDTGARYTIKRYESAKVEDDTGQWKHSKILLKPETTEFGYRSLEFDESAAGDLAVLAEFVAVIG
jgi:DUF2075 family protein